MKICTHDHLTDQAQQKDKKQNHGRMLGTWLQRKRDRSVF